MPPWSCDHSKPALDVYGNASPAKWKEWQFEMFDNQRWMIREEAKQAIPICYTDFIAVQVTEVLERI